MATLSLSGSGVQALTSGTTALYVTITTLPAGLTHGRANPTNHFDIALFRFSDGTGYANAIPIAGGPDWISIPAGSTSVGYSVLNGALLSVTEIFGVVSPTPGITVTFPAALIPKIISPASQIAITSELAGNGVSASSSSTWGTANLTVLYPVRISESFTSATAWVRNGVTATGHWDIGVYDDSFVLLGHTGSIVQAGANALQSTAFVITLTPGRYWFAMSSDSASLTAGGFSLSVAVQVRIVGVRTATSNFPLASGPTLSTPAIASVPSFGLATYTP